MPVTQDLTEVIDKLLAQGLLALRENAVMPQLVNRRYEEMAGESGTSIDIPIPSAVAVSDVAPSYIPPDIDGVVPTSVSIVLDRWKEAGFFLSDRDRLEAMSGVMPMQASEAIKAVCNEVDSYLLSRVSSFYGYVDWSERTGSPLAPFDDDRTTDATSARTVLSEQLAPNDPRHFVADPTVEGYALNVRAFQDMSWSGSVQALLEGNLNRKLGFNWWMDQNVQSHVPGWITDSAVIAVGAAAAVGAHTATLDTGAGEVINMNAGDIIKFSNHDQPYVLTVDCNIAATSSGTVTFEPGLVAALATTDTLDALSNAAGNAGSAPLRGGAAADGSPYTMNFFFHRDALGLVTRPLAGSSHPSSVIASNIDIVSGLALRVEMTREHRRDKFAYDILYGADVVRREFGGRFLGN